MGNNTKELGKKGQRRPIVIDGCNVAYHHGRHDMFSGDLVQYIFNVHFLIMINFKLPGLSIDVSFI